MERDQPRTHVTPRTQRHEVLDFTADVGYDAVEFGDMDPKVVASALREAANEIEKNGHKHE